MRRIAAAAFLAIAFLVPASIDVAAGQDSNKSGDDVSAYASIAPPFVLPAKDKFITHEGDPFILTITATCLLEDQSVTQFELLSGSPGFVHVSSPYRNEIKNDYYTEGLAVIEVHPQIGDAGKYVVRIRVKSCSGKVERVITLRVRVKPAL